MSFVNPVTGFSGVSQTVSCDNGRTNKDGPGGALTPLFPGLAAAIKERD